MVVRLFCMVTILRRLTLRDILVSTGRRFGIWNYMRLRFEI